MILRKRLKMMCLSSVAFAVLACGATIGYAEEENKVKTLSDALAVGISTNPEYGIVAANRRATDEELKQGRALFLPSVDVNGDVGFEHTDDVGTRGGTDGDDEEDLFRREVGVTLTQLLFDGYDSHYEVQRQKARVTSASYRVRETAELVGLSIVEAYLEVLRQRQLLFIANENLQEHIRIHNQIKDGVAAGRLTKADEDQVIARLSASRSTISRTTEDLIVAQSQYRREVGDIAGDLKLPIIPYDALEENVDLEVSKALGYSPTLDIFASDIEVAYAEAQGAKSTQYPQLDLQLNARNGDDLGGVEGRDTSASALVTLNWNLYRGGADIARAREFVHRHQEAKETRSEAERAVEDDVRQTWASMVASSEQSRYFAQQAGANSSVVKAYQDQFNLDRRTLLDVLDAQNELFVSRSSTVNSEFLEMLAVYRLLSLKGQLLPTLQVEYPRESELASDEQWPYKKQQKAR